MNSAIQIKKLFYLFVALALAIGSCRKDETIVPSTTTPVAPGASGPIKGFFLLNEANMGSNKASLDYFDYTSGEYHKNIYPTLNPTIVKELGDVGNDIQIYGNKLYAVINVSHLIEVMDVSTGKHVATISIPNCRYITFDKGYAYVSSYAGPVLIDPNARLGYVARIDTASLTIKDTCVVGYQPEEMAIRDNKLYVANSGGYRAPNYDNTVSVIDLNAFKETAKITVGTNLHRMKLDSQGNIYVSSRGDNKNVPSNIYIIGPTDKVTDVLNLPASNMVISGDSLYVYSAAWSNIANSNTITYAIVNTRQKSIVSRNFITDGTEKNITIPYGLAINPETREIFVTDAKNYVSPGRLHCYSPEGKHKWDVETGDIPAHIVFTRQKLTSL
ncbi:MAG: YncE family protein [Chitinophagaceae bacterium]|nr:YncE family protein [Chitinophagaceae bacterium]